VENKQGAGKKLQEGLLERTREQDVGAGCYLLPPQEILFGPRGGFN
jgi:hypothetical protein